MPVPYSERFLTGQAFNGTLTYTVPPGKRAIVSCVDFLVLTSVSVTVILAVKGTTIAALVSTANVLSQLAWRGHQVAYAGETIVCTSTGIASMAASGYLLDDP